MGFLISLIGGFLVVNSPVNTIIIDRNSNLMVLHSQAIIRRHTWEIPLKDIVSIDLQRNRNTIRLIAVTSTSTFPMTGYYGSSAARKKYQADQLCKFLDLQSEATHKEPV